MVTPLRTLAGEAAPHRTEDSVSLTESSSDVREPKSVPSFHIPHGQLAYRNACFQLLIRDNVDNQTLLDLTDIQHDPLRAPPPYCALTQTNLLSKSSNLTLFSIRPSTRSRLPCIRGSLKFRRPMPWTGEVNPDRIRGTTQPCIFAIGVAKKNAIWSRKCDASQRGASLPSPSISKKRRVDTTPFAHCLLSRLAMPTYRPPFRHHLSTLPSPSNPPTPSALRPSVNSHTSTRTRPALAHCRHCQRSQ